MLSEAIAKVKPSLSQSSIIEFKLFESKKNDYDYDDDNELVKMVDKICSLLLQDNNISNCDENFYNQVY
jgi:hypothetical protein